MSLEAQQVVTTSGGESVGPGGVASLTIGQVAYTAISSPAGEVSLGVQQAYLDMEVSIEDPTGKVKVRVYPNPLNTTAYIELWSEEIVNVDYTWSLYDLHAKMLKTGSFSDKIATVPFESLPSGVYFINVTSPTNFSTTIKLVKSDSL